MFQENERIEITEKPFVEIKLYDENGKLIPEIKEGYKSELRIGNIHIRFTKKFETILKFL